MPFELPRSPRSSTSFASLARSRAARAVRSAVVASTLTSATACERNKDSVDHGTGERGGEGRASGAQASVLPSNKVYEVGQTATTGFYSLRVLHVTTCSVEPHLQPPPGVRRLGVEVELSATTETKVPANPFYALVSDRSGERYEATLAGCTPVLAAAQISQGETARGWISFDVPESMAGARLSYAPAVLGGGRPEVSFVLEP